MTMFAGGYDYDDWEFDEARCAVRRWRPLDLRREIFPPEAFEQEIWGLLRWLDWQLAPELLFTLADGSGGQPEDLDEVRNAETFWEAQQQSRIFYESAALAGRAEYARSDAMAARLDVQVAINRSRARAVGLSDSLTLAEWQCLLELFGHCCAYCRERKPLVLEHVVPVIRGGGTTATNCVPACQGCNSRKHARSLDEWLSADDALAFRIRHGDVLERLIMGDA